MQMIGMNNTKEMWKENSGLAATRPNTYVILKPDSRVVVASHSSHEAPAIRSLLVAIPVYTESILRVISPDGIQPCLKIGCFDLLPTFTGWVEALRIGPQGSFRASEAAIVEGGAASLRN